MGLENLERLKMDMQLLFYKKDSDALFEDLIAACAKCREEMWIQPINFQVHSDLVFLIDE